MKKQGFTLIELLVVVAIIGILATVVLASLNSAREKASIAKIKAQMASMHAATILNYDNTSSHATACTAISTMVTSAGATCFDDATTWAATTQLTSTAADGTWCVDSTGYTGFTSTVVDADGELCTPSATAVAAS